MARSIFISQIRDTGNILAGLTTANLVEGSNLYFTNARVYSNVIALLPTLAGSGIQIQANGQINANAQALSLTTLSPFLTTSNVSEGSNLYYTNARVISYVTNYLDVKANVGDLATANVRESASNLYYTNARVNSNVIAFLPSLAGQYITIQANGQISSNLSTDATIVIAANGQIRSNTSSGGITSLAGFTTANLAEGGANLYFSNARAQAAMAGGTIFRPSIATFRGNAQLLNYALPITPANNNYITVIINGVTQLSNAYTLSGNTLVLSGYPAANADIDVRIIDVTQTLAKDFNSRLFYGNGSANVAAISNNFTDSSILVFENGVAQVPGVDYSASGGVLRFATPPRTGVTVEIRELPTLNGTQTYVGGQNIVVQANGQINATVQEQIHPFLLSLL